MTDNEAIKIPEAEDYECEEYMETDKAWEATLAAVEALKKAIVKFTKKGDAH